jgi:hypothetical protein
MSEDNFRGRKRKIENAVFRDVCRVVLVRTDASEERIASIIRATRIGELGTAFAVTNNRRTQQL